MCSSDLNPSCISRTEARHVVPRLRLVEREPIRGACAYCTRDIPFTVVGCSSSGIYHAPDSPSVRQILDEHIVLLESAAAAEELGFRAAVVPGAR